MANYLGDVVLSQVLNSKFSTNDGNGAPSSLSSATVKVYKDNDTTTETTTGVTVTTDFDSVTGLNNVKIDTSTDGTFYAAGHDFQVILTAGTVDSTSIMQVLFEFSIQNRSALRPTTAGRTLDVAATGEAGLDFDNIKDATAPHTLTNVTVPAVTTVGSVTGAVGSVTGAVGSVTGNVGGNVTGSVGSVLGNVAGTVASVVGNVGGNVVGSVGSVLGNIGGNVVGSVASVLAGVTITAASVQAIWDALTSALTTVGSIGKLIVTNLDALISSRASAADYTTARAAKLDNLDTTVGSRLATSGYTAPDNTTIGTINTKIGTPASTVSADIAAVKAVDDAIKLKTDTLPASPANEVTSAAIKLKTDTLPASPANEATSAAIKLKTDLIPAVPASQSDVTTVGTAVAAVSSKLGTPAGASVSADIAAVKAVDDAIKTKTDNLPADPASNTQVNTRLATSGYTAPDNTTIGTINSKLGTPAGASVSADVAAVKAQTQLIQNKTDLIPGSGIASQASVDNIAAALNQIPVQKNVAFPNFTFMMTDSTNHLPITGLTVSANRAIDGGAFASCANPVVEMSGGYYKIDFAAADLNGDVIGVSFSATGADTLALTITTQ